MEDLSAVNGARNSPKAPAAQSHQSPRRLSGLFTIVSDAEVARKSSYQEPEALGKRYRKAEKEKGAESAPQPLKRASVRGESVRGTESPQDPVGNIHRAGEERRIELRQQASTKGGLEEIARDFAEIPPTQRLKDLLAQERGAYGKNPIPKEVVAAVVEEFLEEQGAMLGLLNQHFSELDKDAQAAVARSAIDLYHLDRSDEIRAALEGVVKGRDRVIAHLTSDPSFTERLLLRRACCQAIISQACSSKGMQREVARIFTQIPNHSLAAIQLQRVVAGIELARGVAPKWPKGSFERTFSSDHWAQLYKKMEAGELTPDEVTDHYHAVYRGQAFEKDSHDRTAANCEKEGFKSAFDGLFRSALEAKYGEEIAAAWVVSNRNPVDFHTKRIGATIFLGDVKGLKKEEPRKSFLDRLLCREIHHAETLLSGTNPVNRWFDMLNRLTDYPRLVNTYLGGLSNPFFATRPKLKRLAEKIGSDSRLQELQETAKSPIKCKISSLIRAGMQPLQAAAWQSALSIAEGDISSKRSREAKTPPSRQDRPAREISPRFVAEQALLPEKTTFFLQELFETEERFYKKDLVGLCEQREECIARLLEGSRVAIRDKKEAISRAELEEIFDVIEKQTAEMAEFNDLFKAAEKLEGSQRLVAVANAIASPAFDRYYNALAVLTDQHDRLNKDGTYQRLRAASLGVENVKSPPVTLLDRWLQSPADLLSSPMQRLTRWPMTLDAIASPIKEDHPLRDVITGAQEIAKNAARRVNEQVEK